MIEMPRGELAAGQHAFHAVAAADHVLEFGRLPPQVMPAPRPLPPPQGPRGFPPLPLLPEPPQEPPEPVLSFHGMISIFPYPVRHEGGV